MLSAIRFVMYSGLSSLAKLFIDREIRRHQAKIFAILDHELWRGGARHPLREPVLKSIIRAATNLDSVDDRQVQQVRDLFDPLKFAQGEKR